MGFFVSNIHIYSLKSNSYESNFWEPLYASGTIWQQSDDRCGTQHRVRAFPARGAQPFDERQWLPCHWLYPPRPAGAVRGRDVRQKKMSTSAHFSSGQKPTSAPALPRMKNAWPSQNYSLHFLLQLAHRIGGTINSQSETLSNSQQLSMPYKR